MLDCLASWVAVEHFDVLGKQGYPTRSGNFLDRLIPFRVYEATDGHLAIPASPGYGTPNGVLNNDDFFYYLVHRFLFHDGPLGAPLKWVHAVHHQMKNPCRMDSAYLHPIETCLGIALYGVTFAALASVLGDFHVITAITTFVAFSAINQHNHDLMEVDHFPFKYLKYMSDMHHVHHARFIGGNFATISLLYDWLFGTYDTGDGWGKHKRSPAPRSEVA